MSYLKKIFKIYHSERAAVAYGITSPIFYVFADVLTLIMYAWVFDYGFKNNMDAVQVIFTSALSTLIKDLTLFITMLIVTKGKLIDMIEEIHQFRTRGFWLAAASAFFGGPIAYTFASMTLLFGASVYKDIWVALTPFLFLMSSKLLLGAKLDGTGWIATGIAFFGMIGYQLFLWIDSGSTGDIDIAARALTIVFPLIAMLGFFLESLLAGKLHEMDDEGVDIIEKLAIKGTVGTTFNVVLVIPLALVSVEFFPNSDWADTASMLGTLFTHPMTYLFYPFIGILVTIGRIFYWASFDLLGAKATFLNYQSSWMYPIATLLILPFVEIFPDELEGLGKYVSHSLETWYYYAFNIVGIIGTGLLVQHMQTGHEHWHETHQISF